MKIALWIVQILLAVAFGMTGAMKAFTPLPELAAQMPWVAEAPSFVPRLAGLAELAGAVGLILPAATRIKPVLTPLAALGLIVVMILALAMHLVRGELAMLGAPLVLGSLAAFVWWGRSHGARIEPR
jgi:uncharacterized membrane protein YphA (DoxX/SURF4 family)